MPQSSPPASRPSRVRLPLASERDGHGAEQAGVDGHHRTKGLVRLTMACGERCRFCNLPAEDHERVTLDDEEVERTLEAFIAGGERTLTISGGEPTMLRSRLLSLVARARAGGIPFVELQTNAVLIDGPYAAELAQAGLTSAFVSLLSHDEAIHDQLMGREGTQHACLGGIDALLSAGVHVTLNPVITSAMQERLGDYIDFVAERLPGVRSISLSVVQPHGRAARDRELMPDYTLLGPSVRDALGRARGHGIEVINPYCGLPLCVGWEGAVERSVEAVEALERRGASLAGGLGVDNRGDKRHGAVCRPCALRTRCGGAWHAYWELREGRGLKPPAERLEPWLGRAAQAPEQTVLEAPRVDQAVLQRLAEASTPTVWLALEQLARGDGKRLLTSGCTDLALTLRATELLEGGVARELRAIARHADAAPPQAQVRVALRLRIDTSFQDTYRALELAQALGVDTAVLWVDSGDDRWRRFVAAAQAELPGIELSLLEPPPPDQGPPERALP